MRYSLESLGAYVDKTVEDIFGLEIKYAHEIMVQGIAKFSGFDSETNNFNDHYLRKFIGGIAFEFLSGTLFDKRDFVFLNEKSALSIREDELENTINKYDGIDILFNCCNNGGCNISLH